MIKSTFSMLLAALVTTGAMANTASAEVVALGYTKVKAAEQQPTTARKGMPFLKTSTAQPSKNFNNINKPGDPQAIGGALDRDIIRRSGGPTKETPKPKPEE